MKALEDARKDYEDIPVPHELSERIMLEVKKADRRRRKQMIKRMSRYGLAAAASFTILFTIGLNTSVAFASAAESLPVIGTVAKVLTFRSYETKTEDLNISVEIPSIDMISEEFQDVKIPLIQRFMNFAGNMQRKQKSGQKSIGPHFWIREEHWRSGMPIILK